MLLSARVAVALAICVLGPPLLGVHAAFAQTAGFIEAATSTAYRQPLSATTIQALLPSRGRFTFPAPYGTVAARLTNATDCGGSDCLNYVGYSYWRNINNHVGSDTMLIVLGLSRSRGGASPTLFTYHKTTGETRNGGPLFDAASSHSWATGEGWYFSATRATALYMNEGPRMLRYDVVARTFETVFDARAHVGRTDVYIWQMHSSHDDRVHSATVKNSQTYQSLGCLAYREDTGQATFVPAIGDFDECQIDKSGRWLVIKENIDGRYGEDNRIIDLSTGLEQVFYDEQGAAGHSDVGHGYMVAEDNYASLPGAARVWQFDQSMTAPGQGTLVYHLASWNSGLGHVAHGNAGAGVPLDQQVACSSNATRLALPRVNEIVCYRLDGSLNTLVVAPNLTNLDAAGGGSDDYSKMPKGNLDVTGEYFLWTSNAGGNRLDAFIVHVPLATLGVTATGSTPTSSEPGGSPGGVTWASLVNVTASGSTLQKTSGCDGCGDATALSDQTVSGSGTLDWVVPETATLRVVGLSSASSATTIGNMPFAIRFQAGIAEVRELGIYRTDVPFSAGDTFRIAVDNGTVRYLRNGTVFYTSGTASASAMRVHAIFYGMGGSIGSVAVTSTSSSLSTSATSDTTAPMVAVQSPAAGATLSGTVLVKAAVTDDVAVGRVEFYLGGALQATDTTAPYEWSWITTATPDGTHSLQAKAYDAAGNAGTSAAVSVTVRNAAAIQLAVRAYTVKGRKKVDLSWSGATATQVDLYRNGSRINTTPNDGFYTDGLGRSASTYRYRVCNAGTSTCSAEVTASF